FLFDFLQISYSLSFIIVFHRSFGGTFIIVIYENEVSAHTYIRFLSAREGYRAHIIAFHVCWITAVHINSLFVCAETFCSTFHFVILFYKKSLLTTAIAISKDPKN
ncbi:hypothetical protein AAK882_04025, partial [Carnobacteriaceae bacterium 52-44]